MINGPICCTKSTKRRTRGNEDAGRGAVGAAGQANHSHNLRVRELGVALHCLRCFGPQEQVSGAPGAGGKETRTEALCPMHASGIHTGIHRTVEQSRAAGSCQVVSWDLGLELCRERSHPTLLPSTVRH
ncbi:hypothetical protein NDU88_002270 [Pleurodeles waltl]|uniref:Uncharacterized protein n=1 Tax=Pleurodeles waltl TaxID=8319 RepID=A0AAV7P677_PLEWA|nr:hypothetical protein NDU88_002270 [Pleurodeles waltl]